MFDKSLIALLTSTILSCSITSAWGQESNKLEITFACEDDNGLPITVAKNKNNEEQTETIFYWREEALTDKTFSSPQELCNDVSLKINKMAQDYDLSSFAVVATEVVSRPVICISSNNNSCSKVLFAMRPTSQPVITADRTLTAILNPKIVENQRQKDRFNMRAHLQQDYEIDFTELFNTKLNTNFKDLPPIK